MEENIEELELVQDVTDEEVEAFIMATDETIDVTDLEKELEGVEDEN